MAASCAGGILQQTVLDRITGRLSQATDGPTACAICLTDFGDAPVWPWPAGCGHLLHKDSFAQLLAARGSEAAYRPSCQRGQQGRFRLCPCVHGYWEDVSTNTRAGPPATTKDGWPSMGAAFVCTADERPEPRTGPTRGHDAAGGGPEGPSASRADGQRRTAAADTEATQSNSREQGGGPRPS